MGTDLVPVSKVSIRERAAWARKGLGSRDWLWSAVTAVISAVVTIALRREEVSPILIGLAIGVASGGIALGVQYMGRFASARGDVLADRLTGLVAERDELGEMITKVTGQRTATYGTLDRMCFEAIQLEGQPVQSDEDWKKWRRAYEVHKVLLYAVLRPVLKPHEWHEVSYVDLRPNQPHEGEFNKEHRTCWQALHARILVMREVMKNYAD